MMLSKYQDKWGRYHDKPCYDLEPSSNNGWIYSAYAHQLGLVGEDHINGLNECIHECRRGSWPLTDRSPGKLYPPLSRDEVLGLFYYGFVSEMVLSDHHWQFCNLPGFTPKPLYKVNWFKAALAVYRVWRAGHRNALWNEPDLWNLGFRLPPQDTWYILRKECSYIGTLHTLYFYISSWLTILGKSNSGKLILWLKLKDLRMEGSVLYSFLEWERALKEYFGEHHDFTKAIE